MTSSYPLFPASDLSPRRAGLASLGGDDGIRSQRELRALVAVGSNSPPDCYSLPPLFESIDSSIQGIPLRHFTSHGGDDGIRTHDPLLAGQVLSQLSYTPINGCSFLLLGTAVNIFYLFTILCYLFLRHEEAFRFLCRCWH